MNGRNVENALFELFVITGRRWHRVSAVAERAKMNEGIVRSRLLHSPRVDKSNEKVGHAKSGSELVRVTYACTDFYVAARIRGLWKGNL